ncbi:MAG: hypothetical protein ACLVI9_07155 [Anaerostipes hadrus]
MPPSVKTVKGTFSCTSKGFGFVTVEGKMTIITFIEEHERSLS